MQRWLSPARRRWAFWSCALVVLVLALMKPVHHMPTTGWDKANHALAFFVLAVLGAAAYPRRWARVLLGLLAYGALIEALQGLTGWRDAEWLDLLADGVGLALASPIVRRLATALSRGGGEP